MNIPVALLICALLALAVRRFSLPPIPAYIVAGLALGKAGLGIFEPDEVTKSLSELGIVFLLFYVGLELNPRKIAEKGSEIAVSGLVDFAVNFSFGFLVALLFGFSFVESFVIASAIYISSSAIVIQSLIENRKLIFSEAETIIWLMVFEDILLILLILAISADVSELILFFAKVILLACAVFVPARLLHRHLASIFHRNDEVPILLAFSLASLAAYAASTLEIPEALAAIFLGIALSGIREVEVLIQPFKEVFLVIFFFFFGVSVELGYIDSILITSLILIAILGKLLGGLIIGRIVHKSTRSGVEIGTSIVARGEFSIFLASLYGLSHISSIITLLVVATSIIGSVSAKYGYILKRYI
ncbi:cation:proton antiporter [Archaeoglobus veneficus]|uniref:Sodium/hydrogen exchanger n=1 Tax=Archaeoglobus veneficus (strain DSM 11195 / SNP6) TaxID=693661 RepID=F2KR78_ARCVS|nr:cation:proton antiporter [Archaeoglobus veneficus]AEA46715.1 sodium/hydrogen exchanger [Archaeoglobus veneficus SNP6]